MKGRSFPKRIKAIALGLGLGVALCVGLLALVGACLFPSMGKIAPQATFMGRVESDRRLGISTNGTTVRAMELIALNFTIVPLGSVLRIDCDREVFDEFVLRRHLEKTSREAVVDIFDQQATPWAVAAHRASEVRATPGFEPTQWGRDAVACFYDDPAKQMFVVEQQWP